MCRSVGKPNSVADNHLSGLAIACGLERHSPVSCEFRSTALHWGKGLAVSSLRCRRGDPRGTPAPFGAWRFCSHLVRCRRRALPATCTNQMVQCSDFPPEETSSDCLTFYPVIILRKCSRDKSCLELSIFANELWVYFSESLKLSNVVYAI